VLGYYELMGSLHTGVLSVDVDVDPGKYKDKLPDSDDIVDGGNKGADWLSTRSGSFWTVIIILVAAALVAGALKRPIVRGMLIGVILLGVALAIVNN
jgi:hypothetical protein